MSIEIEVADKKDCMEITIRDTIQMYAGDRGTSVYASIVLDKKELFAHIVKLIKVWRTMK